MNCGHCGAERDAPERPCPGCGAVSGPSEEALPTCRMAPLVLPGQSYPGDADPEPVTLDTPSRGPDTEPDALSVADTAPGSDTESGRPRGVVVAGGSHVTANAVTESEDFEGPTRISVPALSGSDGSLALPLFDGKYEAQRELGRGGMGVVFYGEDLSLGRPVAIKILATRFSDDPVQAERFHREARILATLDHPAIVPIYAYGQENGQRYFVMKYVEGVPLNSPEAPLSGSRLQRVRGLKPVFDALQYAHDREVLHRDLKPANIMLDANRRPCLLDFGIAIDPAMARVTQQNTLVGTPGYMSPEQARDPRQLTPASDQYSMGVIIYELFCGALPFDARSALTLAVQQLVSAPKPLRERNPDVPAEVAAVVDRALAVQPEARFPSVTEFYEALARSCAAAADAPPPASRALPPTVLSPVVADARAATPERKRPAVRVVRVARPQPVRANTPQAKAAELRAGSGGSERKPSGPAVVRAPGPVALLDDDGAAPTERLEPLSAPVAVRKRPRVVPVAVRPAAPAQKARRAASGARKGGASKQRSGLLWLVLVPVLALVLVTALLLALSFTSLGPWMRRAIGSAPLGGHRPTVHASHSPGWPTAPPPLA